jgi:quinolinate synthase
VNKKGGQRRQIIRASTPKMIDYFCNSTATQLLLLGECSVGDNIITEHPKKRYGPILQHPSSMYE